MAETKNFLFKSIGGRTLLQQKIRQKDDSFDTLGGGGQLSPRIFLNINQPCCVGIGMPRYTKSCVIAKLSL